MRRSALLLFFFFYLRSIFGRARGLWVTYDGCALNYTLKRCLVSELLLLRLRGGLGYRGSRVADVQWMQEVENF